MKPRHVCNGCDCEPEPIPVPTREELLATAGEQGAIVLGLLRKPACYQTFVQEWARTAAHTYFRAMGDAGLLVAGER